MHAPLVHAVEPRKRTGYVAFASTEDTETIFVKNHRLGYREATILCTMLYLGRSIISLRRQRTTRCGPPLGCHETSTCGLQIVSCRSIRMWGAIMQVVDISRTRFCHPLC
jgi:hypothetical protein